MLHAPTSENNILQSKSQQTAVPAQELHPHALAPLGLSSLNHAGGIASAQQRQRLAAVQNTRGNQAALHMLHSPQTPHITALRPSQTMLQRKCACGGTPGPTGECAACRAKRLGLQRQQSTPPAPTSVNTVPPIVHDVLRSPGQPLDATTRTFMEPRFGQDFGQVRVHTDATAAETARAVNALAYTVGRDVVFGAGQYAPGTSGGMRLMAHELAHVVQQNGVRPTGRLEIGKPDSLAEREASSITKQLTWLTASPDNRQPIPLLQRVTNPVIMRTPIFTSKMEICHQVLKSPHVFDVPQGGGVIVTADANWEASSRWEGKESPSCGREIYNVTLSRVGWLFDTDVASCQFAHGKPVSRNWTNLPQGKYYITIWTNNTNPNCCLLGNITVSQESGLSGPTCGGLGDLDIASLSSGEKIVKALELSASKMGGETGQRIKELLTPKSLALMAAFTSAYVISQTTPIGWVADIIVAGLIAATVLMVGQEAVEIVKLLIEFFKTATEATNKEDIDKAAELFAKAVTKVGIDIVVAILFHKAGKAANLTPPGPRSPGLVQVLKVGGGKLMTTLNPPIDAAYVAEGGMVIRMPIEKVPNTAMMMEGQNMGGSSPKTGGRMGTAEVEPTEPAGQKPSSKLPGKDTIAANALPKQRRPPLEESQPPATENEPSAAQKETGSQQERRLLREDRASGRPANSATYHVYEGGSRGSFRIWFDNVQNHIRRTLKGQSTEPRLNDAPLRENAHAFIEKHPNLKAAWEKMNVKIDTQLKAIQSQKSAAAGDRVRIRELERIETALEKRRAELTEFESGEVGNKRPDLVELFFSERRSVVTDITQRTGDPLHNFKTEFYIALIKDVLGWSDVNGVNFNTVYDQNISPD